MKQNLLAAYERTSTLWKNANALYKATDYVRMECLFMDMSDYRDRKIFTAVDKSGNDITDKVYCDKYIVRLINSRGHSKDYAFDTKADANAFFLQIKKDRILGNFKRVI